MLALHAVTLQPGADAADSSRAQVFVLSVPSVGMVGPKTPDTDHYFVRDLVLRLQIGQTNPDGSPLNRQASQLLHDLAPDPRLLTATYVTEPGSSCTQSAGSQAGQQARTCLEPSHQQQLACRESMSLPYDRAMPYELKALECALAAALRILSRDWAELDAEARTPLERLTHKVLLLLALIGSTEQLRLSIRHRSSWCPG